MAVSHDDVIKDQFTKQAVPFAEAPIHRDGMDLLRALAAPQPDDAVLDVACGPGIVACALAPDVGWVTGVDLTPEMIAEAARAQAARGLTNLSWQIGSATALPFEDGTFTLVLTRYSFHHLQDPAAALAEMFRVCRPGGRVVVADLSIPSPQGERFDEVEKLRDPSHVRALPPAELRAMFGRPDAGNVRQASYGLDIELEPQLARSFPVEGGPDRIRRAYAESMRDDALGIGVRDAGGRVWSTWPVTVVAAVKC